MPQRPPYTLTKDEDPEHGREIDALYALAMRMRGCPPDEWPDLLLMIGDQVYADEDAPRDARSSSGSGGAPRSGPGEEVADFEEYTRLYRETWGEEAIRWLLSTVPSAMIFDDHDVHDDWNTSISWLDGDASQALVGPADHGRVWPATGSTSTSATSRPRRSQSAGCSPR